MMPWYGQSKIRKGGRGLTWDVQTLLNVTKANVCAIMDVARSFFATTSGMSTQESSSCGRNASDSVCSDDDVPTGMAELR